MLANSLANALRIVALATLPVALLAGPASAQLGPDGDIKIGIILPDIPEDAPAWRQELPEQVLHGAVLGQEEVAFNAELLGIGFEVFFENATGPEAAVAAAERMAEEGVLGVVGGYSLEEALALGDWAEESGIPFINIGSQADALRNDQCGLNTFHVEASAGMYLDSLAGWYIRDGYRRWYVVRSDNAEGDGLQDRLDWSLNNRHFGVDQVGDAVYVEGTTTSDIIAGFEDSGADLLVLLLDAGEQLEVMAGLEEAGFDGQVAGYPHAATQTREYFVALSEVAPSIEHYRAVIWEPTLDTSGSIEFNLRHRNRWDGETMDGPAWAGYHAVKILFDSASFSRSVDPAEIMSYMRSPNAVFDLHKLLGASFRPWNQQLRQPLYLVNIDPQEESKFQMGLLVGQLPSLYLPGTEPNERLDQIGDLANGSTCDIQARLDG